MATLVKGPIKLVTDRPDTVRKVNLRAPRLRLHGAGIVTDHNDGFPVVDGVVEFPALPGPAVLTLVTAGGQPLRSVDIVVPDEETAKLSECLDQTYTYDPPVVGRAQQFAREASEHADRAEAGADRVGSAEQVSAWASAAEQARDDAETAANHADTQAGVATEQAGLAGQHRQAAEDAADSAHGAAGAAAEATKTEIRAEMDTKVSEAEQSAQSSGESATASATSAGESATSAQEAGQSAQAAGEHLQDTRDLKAGIDVWWLDELLPTVDAVAADRAATQDDRRQTGEDRSAVESAAVQVADDRRQAGEDRVATGEDRAHIDDQVDLVTDHVDQNVAHVDSQVSHVDNQAAHVDGQVAHIDSQVEQVGVRADQASTAAEATADDRRQTGEDRTATGGHLTEVTRLHGEAELARDDAQEAAANAKLGAPPEGWQRDDLHVDVREDLSRARSALQNVPDATGGARGVIRLAGDLGGSATSPTVPGLSNKSDVGHGHEVDDVDGLGTALAGAGKTAEWGQVSGKPSVFPPEGHRHPADQIDNLDALIDQRAGVLVREAPKMHVWDGEGTWVAPAGAGPNDSVLNLSSGEIHSVQEVN